MKNGITLLIATILLVLCVVQKETRYGSAKPEGVEKMYNSSPVSQRTEGISQQPEIAPDSEMSTLVSVDSTFTNATSARLVNQRLLNISANSKILN